VENGDGRLVATSSSWAFDIPVPGGRVNAAGLTFVGVRPDFRRRGLLRAMMMRHFADCARRGEPISMLTASESEIYPRFGYGCVNWAVYLEIPKGATLREVPGADGVEVSFETADAQTHGQLCASLHREAGHRDQARPGWTPDATSGWIRWRFTDHPTDCWNEALRMIIARRDGRPTGFATFWRETARMAESIDRVCRVHEIVSLDPPTTRALWSTLTNLDLVGKTLTPLVALDDPLLTLLSNPRAAKPMIEDDLFVRIIDLPTALSARRYSAPVDVVVEVRDPIIGGNNGLWRLEGGTDYARVNRAEGGADVTVDIRDLSALYLGGKGMAGLVDAGVALEHTRGAAERLSAAMTSYRQPGESRGF
jgi:predicted acetyltransferase